MRAITPNALDRWHRRLALTIQHLHQPDFLTALVDVIHQLISIESNTVSLECKGHAPILLYERGIAERFHEAIIHRYLSRGYPLSPLYLAVEEDFPEGFYTFSKIAPNNSSQSVYYQTYYLGTGAVEDVYYIPNLGPTEKLSICLYSGFSASHYDDAQVATLAGLAPPMLELARQFCAGHTDLLPNPQAGLASCLQEVLRGFGRGVLASRKHETCHLLLSGHSAESNARLMDVSPETTCAHRKNLYTKLGVGSRSELLALFIKCPSQGQRVGPWNSRRDVAEQLFGQRRTPAQVTVVANAADRADAVKVLEGLDTVLVADAQIVVESCRTDQPDRVIYLRGDLG